MNDNILTFKVEPEEINNCKPLDSTNYNPTDCAINVIDFFKIIDKNIALNLSKLKNTTEKGTLIPEIIYFLTQHNPSLIFKEYDIYDLNKKNDYFQNFINKKLKSNEGFIALFSSELKMGHAVFIAKDSNNKLFIIDRQQSIMTDITDMNNLNTYMNNHKFDKIISFFYNIKSKKKSSSGERKHGLEETDIIIRKPLKTNQKTKKNKTENYFKKNNLKRKHDSKIVEENSGKIVEEDNIVDEKKKKSKSKSTKKTKKKDSKKIDSVDENNLIEEFSKLRI